MSTSFLYHAFNLKGVKYKTIEFSGNEIIFHAEMTRKLATCPVCRSKDVVYKGQKIRDLLLVRCAQKIFRLNLLIHRLSCQQCGNIRWPHLPFTQGKQRYVNSFAIFVNELLKFSTISSAADFLGVSWDLVKSIHKKNLSGLYKQISLRKVRYIAIDEFSIRKGHEYMTIVIDIETGRILHASRGKDINAVSGFLEKLSKKAKDLKAVAIDMSPAYFGAVRKYLPGIDIVFDRFHVTAMINRELDDHRREIQKSLEIIDRKTLKGSRFLLLANYDSLGPDRKARLDSLMESNHTLFVMHTMKEQLRLFWELPDVSTAENFLKTWCKDAVHSGILQLMKIGGILSGHRTTLLNYFKHKITCGKIEGINNKIKTLKRQAYGYRDMEYFMLRLFHLHVQRYSLTG